MAKGNKTSDFWRYDVVTDTWQRLKDVFAGPSGNKVKAGSDMVYVEKNGQGYLYLLKGQRCEFCRFNVAADSWEALTDAPTGAKGKWPDGSWLVYDQAGTIYANKAKYHEFYSFNVAKDSWNAAALKPMPMVSNDDKKKSGAGACGARHNDRLYALKGNNSQELWSYVPSRDSWFEMEGVPLVGATGKEKKVKAGADMVSYEGGNVPVVLLLLKGNKTNEFWRYEAGYPGACEDRSDEEVMAGFQGLTSRATCSITPNPVSGRRFQVAMMLPNTGQARLSIFDALGRCRVTISVDGGKTAELDVEQLALSPGVYIARVDAAGHSTSGKFVITR
jgi:hypothetical protein